MTRETDDNFVCAVCGETVYYDTCACDQPIAQLSTFRKVALFVVKLLIWSVVVLVLIAGWLAL